MKETINNKDIKITYKEYGVFDNFPKYKVYINNIIYIGDLTERLLFENSIFTFRDITKFIGRNINGNNIEGVIQRVLYQVKKICDGKDIIVDDEDFWIDLK